MSGRQSLWPNCLLAKLTSREREILELLQRGLRTTEIAKRLFIEQVTVRSHVCSIVRKLGMPDRQEAIRRLDEAGAALLLLNSRSASSTTHAWARICWRWPMRAWSSPSEPEPA